MAWTKNIFTKVVALLLSISLTLVGVPFKPAIKRANAASKKRVHILGFEQFKKAKVRKKKQKQVITAIDGQVRMALEDNKRITLVSEKSLKKKLKPKPVEGADIEPSVGTKGSKRDIKKAKRYIDDGLDSVDEEEYDDAIDYFEKAEEYIKKAPDRVSSKVYKRMVKMYLAWAIAAYENGDKKEGRKALKKLLAIAPDYELDEEEDYPSKLIKDFRKYQRKGGTATLRIVAYPKKKAIIKLNGEEQDDNPLEKDVYPGLYIVEISAPGYETYTEAIEVPEDGYELKVRLPGGEEIKPKDYRENYKRLKKKLPKGEFDEDFVDDLREVAKAGDLDYIVFGLFYQVDRKHAGFTAFVFSREERYIVKTEPVIAKNIDQAVERTEKLVKQLNKFFKRFPKKSSDYYYEPGKFEVPEFEEEEEEEGEEEVVAYTRKHKKARRAKEEKETVEEEEEAPPPVAEVEEEEEQPQEEEVEQIDLDTDVSFLLDETDKAKREEDMQATGEASFGVQKEPPIYTRWWFWTIIGVVAAGGAITAGVLLAPEGPDNTSTVTLQ